MKAKIAFMHGPSDLRVEEVEVPMMTLNDILAKENAKKVDFMNMDIEGAELKALRGFDIKKYRLELLCVEKGTRLEEDLQGILAYFRDNGYIVIEEYSKMDNGMNWYFKPRI